MGNKLQKRSITTIQAEKTSDVFKRWCKAECWKLDEDEIRLKKYKLNWLWSTEEIWWLWKIWRDDEMICEKG